VTTLNPIQLKKESVDDTCFMLLDTVRIASAKSCSPSSAILRATLSFMIWRSFEVGMAGYLGRKPGLLYPTSMPGAKVSCSKKTRHPFDKYSEDILTL
jgi:hypothetical protein